MKVLTKIAYTTAIALSVFSGGVATYGLTKFAPGAELVIAVMGLLFEAGKLTSFALLHKQMPRLIKMALVSIGMVLMVLNVVGVAGFLSHHYEQQTITSQAVTHTAEAEATAHVASLERQLKAAESGVDKAREAMAKARGDRDQIKAMTAVITAASKERESVAAQLVAAQSRQARAQGSAIEASGEFAAIVFIAHTLHTEQDQVTRYFFLVLASLLDPLAVLLIVAAGYTQRDVAPVVQPVAAVAPARKPKLSAHQVAARKGVETRKRKAREAAIAESGSKVAKMKGT